MSLRDVALVLVVALALPAVALLVRDWLTAEGEEGRRARRGLEALWAVAPLAALGVLIGLVVSS